MKRTLFTLMMVSSSFIAGAQQVYQLNEPTDAMPIVNGQLAVGGSNPSGETIGANNYYLTVNGKPIIPVMGEFHYSRYPNEQWEEQLLKMKAGGVSIVSTYIFWNIHESKEGQFIWTGDEDLRHFVQCCQKLGLQVIVRIGPFDHGEIRNGGLPDWLYTKPVDVRSNDALYLKYASKLFKQIAGQLQGLYYKDGGPIIGMQIENEHQHAASTWGLSYMGKSEYTSATYDEAFAHHQISPENKKITTAKLGDEHMLTLKHIAEEYGIKVPICTATGWGNAAVLGLEGLPVMAAYPYATWTDVTAMSPYCLFTDLRKTPDYSPVRFDPQVYPSIYAEMGVGIQMGYGQRPKVYPRGVATMLLRSIGSGSNGFGYYMYHGGSSPKMADGVSYYSEGNGMLPRISYDFQAPLGENGLEKESYRRLRLLHSFLSDFQQTLAPMEVVLPANNKTIEPANRDELRYAARMKDGSGFLFLINFQDHDTLRHDMDNIQMKINMKAETLCIPQKSTFTLPKDANIIIPFNMNMDGALLKYAIAQPLMKIEDKGKPHYIFFVPDGINAEYMFDKSSVKGNICFKPKAGTNSTFTIKTIKGETVHITTLTEQQAMNALKLNGKLVITESTVLPGEHAATLLNFNKNSFSYIVYPSANGWKIQHKEVGEVKPDYQIKKYGNRLYSVHFNDNIKAPQVHEYFMNIDYTADVAMAFLDNELIDDDFWHGTIWTIALNRFKSQLKNGDITIRVRGINKDNPCLKSLPREVLPDFSKGTVSDIRKIQIVPEYRLDIKF